MNSHPVQLRVHLQETPVRVVCVSPRACSVQHYWPQATRRWLIAKTVVRGGSDPGQTYVLVDMSTGVEASPTPGDNSSLLTRRCAILAQRTVLSAA